MIAIPTSPRMNRDPTICPRSLLAPCELCRFLDDSGTAKRLLPSTLTHTQELGFNGSMLVQLLNYSCFSQKLEKEKKTIFFFSPLSKTAGLYEKGLLGF